MNQTVRVALITGSTRGIGRSIAETFATAGYSVVITGTSADTAQRVAKEISPHAIGAQVDVANAASVEQLIAMVMERFGRIDVLVNNAGVTRDGLLIRMDEKDWDSVLDINLKGAFLFTKAVARIMMKQRYGRIVNMSSVVGLRGNAGQANYCASKAGLIGLTKSVAKELASRAVTVNAVAPGFIDTDMTAKLTDDAKAAFLTNVPLGRTGSSADVAATVLFLASDQAAYITGQVIAVDGGLTM